MSIIRGNALWFGTDTPAAGLPIENLPPGGRVVRFRFREHRLAAVFVRVGAELQQWSFGPALRPGGDPGRIFVEAQSSRLIYKAAVNAKAVA